MLEVMTGRTWKIAASRLNERLRTGTRMSAANVPVRMQVNGRSFDLEIAPHHTLLDVLRDDVRLTGTKECCAEGECGACTVLVNGQAVCSCLVLAIEMDGQHVTTIEGLASDGRLDPLQEAFVVHGRGSVRLLHPGDDHGGARSSWQPTRSRRASKSRKRSSVIFAAAAATVASSTRSLLAAGARR